MNIGRNHPCPCGSGLKYKNRCLNKAGNDHLYAIFDETGNTGSNYMDPAQPFYTVAGWLVPQNQYPNTTLITELAAELGVGEEIHGTKLIRRPKAQKAIRDLFHDLGQVGCLPMFSIIEKRFFVALKVVESLLDPEYNNLLPMRYTWNVIEKAKHAQKIYELSDDVLKKFSRAYTISDSDLMTESIHEISKALKKNENIYLSNLILGSLDKIHIALELERQINEETANNTFFSINTTSFIALSNMIEAFGRHTGVTITVVHDKTKQFEDAYNEFHNLYKGAKEGEMHLPNGNTIYFGRKRINSFSFANSKNNAWVQAADLLASALNRFLVQVQRKETIPDSLVELARITLPMTLIPNIEPGYPDFAHWMCASVMKDKIMNEIILQK